MNNRQCLAIAAALCVAFGLGMVTFGTALWLGDGADTGQSDDVATTTASVTLNVTVILHCSPVDPGGSVDPPSPNETV